MKYRHVVVYHTGGPEVLQVVEDELPAPIGGQVLVKILAADVGFSDVNIRRGRYPGGPRPPFTPGYAIAGVVERLGPGASGLAAGQAVAALTFYGGYSQYIVLPAQELYPVPAAVDPGEAVTLVLNYVATYQMLHRVAHDHSFQVGSRAEGGSWSPWKSLLVTSRRIPGCRRALRRFAWPPPAGRGDVAVDPA